MKSVLLVLCGGVALGCSAPALAADSSPREECIEKVTRKQQALEERLAKSDVNDVPLSKFSRSEKNPPESVTLARELKYLEEQRLRCEKLSDSKDDAARQKARKAGSPR